MRFALGLIVGIGLTVCVAYAADTMHQSVGTDGKVQAKMVNWEVVNDNLKDLSAQLQDGWNRLTGSETGKTTKV